MNPNKDKILAFEIFGTKLGKDYFVEDLQTDLQIEMLFDLTQILCAGITDIGWKYLLEEIGLQRIYQIDKKSDWFDTEDIEAWIESIHYQSLLSGYNPINKNIGKWNSNLNVFYTKNSKSKIDWDYIRSLTLDHNIE